jgi:predicted lipoprotein with Yx(FWY)xxD motif
MRVIVGLVVATTTVVAGCGSAEKKSSGSGGTKPETEQSSPSSSTTEPAPSSSAEARRGRVIKTASSEFGPMLFDRSGQAIYLFAKERTSKPECYGACAKAWPPVLTKGSPQARGETRSGLLGTTPRRDGSKQVTYKGHPLYFYAHEGKNEVLCHNITENGGLWLVVTPKGDPAPP